MSKTNKITLDEWITKRLGTSMKTSPYGGRKEFTAAQYRLGDRGNGVWFMSADGKLQVYKRLPPNVAR